MISAGLVELEKMGFVEIVTRQGVYVSDYRKSGSLDTLTALLNYNGGVMRDDEVRSLLEVRGANECLCVKLVVERATQEELDGLAPLLDAIKSGKTDEERAEATFQFHHTLSVLSRNAFLPLLYNSIPYLRAAFLEPVQPALRRQPPVPEQARALLCAA